MSELADYKKEYAKVQLDKTLRWHEKVEKLAKISSDQQKLANHLNHGQDHN